MTWNEFVNLFVNSLTSYLRTFRGWEYHQSIRNEKLRFFWRSFIQKTRAQYLKGPLNEGLIRRRLRKPLHRTWRPGRPSPDGVVTRPGRQTQCKGFLNLHCFIRKSKIKTDFDIFWPKSEVWETIFQYITSVYPHYQVILIHELEWIFLSLVIQKLSQNAWISASTPLFYLRLARPQK